MWYPPIEIQNRDDLIIERDPTLLYLDKGYACCLYHCNGTISNVMDLKLFPFDFNLIRLRVIEASVPIKRSSCFGAKIEKLKHVLTDSTIDQLTEWYVIADRIFAERMNTAWSTRGKRVFAEEEAMFRNECNRNNDTYSAGVWILYEKNHVDSLNSLYYWMDNNLHR